MLSSIQNELNPQQLKAVQHTRGPVLVSAGAGSGKTRVLTYRIAHLIFSGEAALEDIFCVTFTNKAASEMKERVEKLLKDSQIPIFKNPWISTFHSACVRILRSHIQLLDYTPQFLIYDSSEQLSLVRKVMVDLNLDVKAYPPKQFQSKINQIKTKLFKQTQQLKPNIGFNQMEIDVYYAFEKELKKLNALDFSDLLLKTYEIFKNHSNVLDSYKNKFKYLMVDEYQDTNQIQYELIKMLSEDHRNLFVVGDEDQSIYSWRGADIQNILNFQKDFFEAKVIKLEKNYRSTQTIVSAASELIKNNKTRNEKVLFTENQKGELITLQQLSTEYDEARFVASMIKELSTFHSLSECAVFYRTNAQSRVLEDEFRMKNIPYKLLGGQQFYERMEIKDILAYMKLIATKKDDVSLKRILNVPVRGIGKSTLNKLEQYAFLKNKPIFEIFKNAFEEKIFNARTQAKLEGFFEMIESLILKSKTLSITQLYVQILKQTQYSQKLQQEGSLESLTRLENLKEFHNALVQFEKSRDEEANLLNFLEEMSLVSSADTEVDPHHVTLMTLHISKGLEFPFVFIVGLEEGLFPSTQSIYAHDESRLEEERRLAYVGMTRAQKKLFLSYAKTRHVWGEERHHPPSLFLNEIPTEFIQENPLNLFNKNIKKRFLSQQKQLSTFSQNEDFHSSSSFPEYENFSDEFNSEQSFQKGMKVRHPKFGVGSIYQLEGQGEKQKISVMFKDRRIRKFMGQYAQLQPL